MQFSVRIGKAQKSRNLWTITIVPNVMSDTFLHSRKYSLGQSSRFGGDNPGGFPVSARAEPFREVLRTQRGVVQYGTARAAGSSNAGMWRMRSL